MGVACCTTVQVCKLLPQGTFQKKFLNQRELSKRGGDTCPFDFYLPPLGILKLILIDKGIIVVAPPLPLQIMVFAFLGSA